MKKISEKTSFHSRRIWTGRNGIVYQVTWKHMKMNPKRTWTTFLGIFFMILLMTCVFVGRKTAVSYLQEVGSQKEGKWHVSMYDVSEGELEKVRNLGYVPETACSADYGFGDFPASGNAMQPYLYVKAYEPLMFEWMNLELKEGRLPENGKEAVISRSALDDGAAIVLGDTIEMKYFDRTITGIKEGISTTFPFQSLTVDYGETLALPWNFPFYEENDSFRINKEYTGEEEEFTVVGVVETPWFEQKGSAGYTAFTCYEGGKNSRFNLSLILDLKKAPDDLYEEMRDIAGTCEIEFNDYVLSFSGDASDSTVNFIVQIMSAFFIIVIMVAAIILIYNVFNISFEERSRYLGMLCSVGATGKQKRSSVYFEAFVLFLPALPLGFLAGCFVVFLGMSLFQPFIYTIMSLSEEVLGMVPVSLEISWEDMVLIAAVSTFTVFLSAILPARKISRVGPVECIRGNVEKEKGKIRGRHTNLRKIHAERLLAHNSMRYQKRKTRGMIRAASVFMVILIITVSGAQMITKLVSYRMMDGATVSSNNEGWDYELFMSGGSLEQMEEFEALKEEIKKDPGVDAVCERYYGTFIGNIPREILSREYWDDVHKVFNLYYHRILSDAEFEENFGYGTAVLSIIAVENEDFQRIAETADVDMDLLNQGNLPCAIVVQSGEVSTENWCVEGMQPEKYAFYEVEKMVDLEKGDTLPVSLYSLKEKASVDFPLWVAGFASNEQLKDDYTFHSETLWVIVNLETGDLINDIVLDQEHPEEHNNMMEKGLLLQLNEEAGPLLKRLNQMTEGEDSVYMLVPAEHAKSLADSINSIIRILLLGFVLLTSVICLLNLYNSIHGWISGQKRNFTMMVSIGMTQKQIEKMLFYEALSLLIRSSLLAFCIGTPLLIGLRECLTRQFGHVRIAFPWGTCAAAIFISAIVIFSFMLYHYRREKKDFRAVLTV